MNAADVLKYGHQTVLTTLDRLAQSDWETPGVCGYWTVKDVIAHLDSYEQMLIEMVGMLEGTEPGPVLRQQMEQGDQFNDNQVAQYAAMSGADVLEQYRRTCEKAMAMVAEVPLETLRKVGTLPHYGLEYAFDDMLVYQYYGHKREHSAQINAFSDRLGQ